MFNIFYFTIILVLGFSSTASAHDCWVQPDTFRLGLGALIFARLFTGHSSKAQKELPFEKKAITRMDICSTSGRTDLLPLAKEGTQPLMEYKTDFIGQGLIAVDKDFTDIELTKEQFTSYLGHEFQTEYIKLLEKNIPDYKQKERYARCMKALVRVGNSEENCYFDRVSGQKLEIVLLDNPFKLKQGSSISAKVLFDNRPLIDRYLTVYNLDEDREPVTLSEKTDENGIARFKIELPGIWLMRIVNIYPCGPEDERDWESYWASYCFEIPA